MKVKVTYNFAYLSIREIKNRNSSHHTWWSLWSALCGEILKTHFFSHFVHPSKNPSTQSIHLCLPKPQWCIFVVLMQFVSITKIRYFKFKKNMHIMMIREFILNNVNAKKRFVMANGFPFGPKIQCTSMTMARTITAEASPSAPTTATTTATATAHSKHKRE